MIKIDLKYQKEDIQEIIIAGHANHEEKGKDIVCAAVSSIVITTVNGIMRLNFASIDYQEEENLIKIIKKDDDKITNTLLFNMIELLFELTTQYPNNIEIRRCNND